jgi:hypothetical protein
MVEHSRVLKYNFLRILGMYCESIEMHVECFLRNKPTKCDFNRNTIKKRHMVKQTH